MANPTQNQEAVLLVEDEFAVRLLCRLALEQGSYIVLEAADGAEAIRECGEHAEPVDLLLTGLELLDMSGEEVAQAVRARHSAIKVLFTSGDPNFAADSGPGSNFWPKPFTPSTLAAKVRDVLAT